MSASRTPGAEWSADVEEGAGAAFDATIGAWRCGRCGTDFEVTSVFASEVRDLTCPVCPAGEGDLTRRGGEGE